MQDTDFNRCNSLHKLFIRTMANALCTFVVARACFIILKSVCTIFDLSLLGVNQVAENTLLYSGPFFGTAIRLLFIHKPIYNT